MKSDKGIIISGAHGYIGGHCVRFFASLGYTVLALVSKVKEHDTGQISYLSYPDFFRAHALPYACLLHCSWNGVTFEERQNEELQKENHIKSKKIIEHCKNNGINKIMVLGSQAEYGNYLGRVDEKQPLLPVDAYGVYKLKTLEYLRNNAETMTWVWLRLFTIYGRCTSGKWFLEMVKSKLEKNELLEVTTCEQRVDYLHIDDLLRALQLVVQKTGSIQDVYNLSSNTSTTLKIITEKVKKLYGSESEIHYGAIAHRKGQVMHQEGNAEKFNNFFNFTTRLNWDNITQDLL